MLWPHERKSPGGAASRSSVYASMRSISVSACAISFQYLRRERCSGFVRSECIGTQDGDDHSRSYHGCQQDVHRVRSRHVHLRRPKWSFNLRIVAISFFTYRGAGGDGQKSLRGRLRLDTTAIDTTLTLPSNFVRRTPLRCRSDRFNVTELGEMQAPRQTASVQALRNTRPVEEIAPWTDRPLQFHRTNFTRD
jgi:hypothetical protein